MTPQRPTQRMGKDSLMQEVNGGDGRLSNMTLLTRNPELPLQRRLNKILNMVDRPKNIGTFPVDGDNDDIYSKRIAVNQFSLLNQKEKYDKNRPPPTYIDYYEYEEDAKRSVQAPMRDLKVREDLNRIEWINEQTNKDNKGLKSYLVKQLAKSLFRGSANVSLPAYAFDPVSNVSAFMNNFRTAPYFMNKAIHVSKDTDPEERIKELTAMCVSSLHQNISFKRAFNPILGETYEGYFCWENTDVLDDTLDFSKQASTNQFLNMRSTTMKSKSQPSNLKNKFINIYVEQISHHPPISSFQIEHGDKLYTIEGSFEEDFKRSGNNLEFRVKGTTTVIFDDDDRYAITWPAKILENNVYMKYDEYIRVEQLNEPYLASMVFLGDQDDQETLGISGIVYYTDPESNFNPKATCPDDLDDISEIVGDIEGSWVKSLIIDGKKYWSIKKNVVSPHIPVSNPLPSDARYREDLVWLWKGSELEIAQKWKVALENAQRKDATLRKKKKK